MTFLRGGSAVLEKPDPCTCSSRWTVNIQIRENSHSPLIKWKNQPALFWFALHLLLLLLCGFFLLLLLFHFTKSTESYYFLKTDYSGVTGLISCSSRCLLQATRGCLLMAILATGRPPMNGQCCRKHPKACQVMLSCICHR